MLYVLKYNVCLPVSWYIPDVCFDSMEGSQHRKSWKDSELRTLHFFAYQICVFYLLGPDRAAEGDCWRQKKHNLLIVICKTFS